MSNDDGVVSISSDCWQKYGCRILKWIDRSISDNCYRVRFDRPGDNIRIVFMDQTHAIFFRLVICQVMDDPDRLLQTIE